MLLEQQLRSHLGGLYLVSELPGFKSWFHFQLQLPVDAYPGKQEVMAPVVGALPLYRKPGLAQLCFGPASGVVSV